MRAKITVPDVDRDFGKAVLIWEGIECTFMRKITGGVQMVSKIYPFKDRLYEEVRIPTEVSRRMHAQAAAILKDKEKKQLRRLSQELKEAQVVVSPTKREEQQQLMLF